MNKSNKKTGNYKHGHARKGHKSKTYKTWERMKYRCNDIKNIKNVNNDNYKYYYKRGIKVCKRWHIFSNFLEDMGEQPEGLTIDRKDNDKGYSKENCRWATITQQSLNKRPYGKSKYRGVYLKKETQKYGCQVNVKGKKIYLSYFKTELEAAKAYNDYVIKNKTTYE